MPGRRVLDLASGEGFGAAILAASADSVVGVDLDERTVEHSRLNYSSDKISFAVADARNLSDFADGSFDAVVAFEMIEHVAEQDRVLDEIKRVLAPDGLVVISTPDREAYQEATPANPFHVQELDAEQFGELLRSRFANVGTWGQRTITGSSLTVVDAQAADPVARSFFVEHSGDGWEVMPAPAPLYLVAVASDAQLPPVAAESTLGDSGLELLRAAEAKTVEAVELKRVTAELDARTKQLARLSARAAHDAHTISSLDAALNAAHRRSQRIEGSVTWQLFERVRGRTFSLLGGEDSRAVDRIQSTLRYVGRQLRLAGGGARATPLREIRLLRGDRTAPIVLPESDEPEVSIVIPLYAHAELTQAALWAIRDNTTFLNYEVILVDDSEDQPTKELLKRVRGAKIIVNQHNLGYLRSVQKGAAAARGRWIVLCNNDIEPQPGWLAAMLDCGESRPDVAIVSPKFLYPDGRLAEAGGIIWRDGTGANYGRGADPTACHYEYRREVDYGSAAALMVKADFWRGVGGFDERFMPMYYEDTDLCFEARLRGSRVMYEPRALVVHVEGATAGVDESASHKANQERNRPKFVEKWRALLDAEHLPNDQRKLWIAANLRRRPRVLVIDHRVPMWDRDSGSLRMRGMLETLVGMGCHVTFLPDNVTPMQPYTRQLQEVGVEVLYGVDPATEIATMGPDLDLVLLSRPQTAGRWLDVVREHAPRAKIVYDTVDLHWLREARRAGQEPGADGDLVLSPRAATMREMELALIRATDATIVVTESERAQVEADVMGTKVHVLPNINEVRASVLPPQARDGLLFVGGFEHTPNTDAVLTLVREVMPLVWREEPGARLTIVGADPPEEVRALASANVEIAGWVQDLEPILNRARALLAPLTYGAGLKGKVTQALAEGLPVVTTPVGAEGLDATDGVELLIGQTPAELAERAIRILRDDELWTRLSEAGQGLAAERCSPGLMADRLRELVGEHEPAIRPAHHVPVQTR
ncbi:MAG: hypothetical protein QOD66_1723 [Solirubrobacteraceae bacterium]|nr:hypothetical protein [Solirubrobacteraceae bacterium]